MARIITSFEEDKSSFSTFAYSCVFVIISVIAVIWRHYYEFSCIHIGMRTAAATSSVVYRKVLRIRKTSDAATSNNVGKLVNMLSNDIVRLDLACHYMHFLWLAPLQLVIILAITWDRMGPSVLAGAVVLIIFTCLQSKRSRRQLHSNLPA